MNLARTFIEMVVKLVRSIFRFRSNPSSIAQQTGQLASRNLLAPETRPYIAL